MPDLGNATLHCSTLKNLPSPDAPPPGELEGNNSPVKALVNGCNWNLNPRLQNGKNRCNRDLIRVLSRCRGGVSSKKGCGAKCLEDYVNDWVRQKVEMGASSSQCYLPFLAGGKKMVECLVCHRSIDPEEELASCSVRNCGGVCHSECVKEKVKFSKGTKFKCHQHACFKCKQKRILRCVRCSIAFHDKCAPWPAIHLTDQPGRAICWRHDDDWRLDKVHDGWRLDKNVQRMIPARDIEEIFLRLPLPYVEEEFKIDLTWKGLMENKLEPPPYVHIRRNIYMVKKKLDGAKNDNECTNCGSICCENCVCSMNAVLHWNTLAIYPLLDSVLCILVLHNADETIKLVDMCHRCCFLVIRVQYISCSKSCHCSENCTNRPFRKDKKIRIVKTELCGWGVEAAEAINKGEFVIEYIGEVISDALCEKRLWDMKYRGVNNFYMCEIRKDFTIDATYKGNLSRFLNNSCDPNCILEKWQVEGETRVGVFAARSIEVGEPLTYDYRFVQFGPEVKCYCGAANCQGYLGTKRKVTAELNIELNIYWGAKRRRSSSSMPCLAIVAV